MESWPGLQNGEPGLWRIEDTDRPDSARLPIRRKVLVLEGRLERDCDNLLSFHGENGSSLLVQHPGMLLGLPSWGFQSNSE